MPDNPFVTGANITLPQLAASTALPLTVNTRASSPVFIDLSDETAKANIVREGFGVAEAKVLPEAFERWLGATPTRLPKETPRVVGQSARPGRKVPAGTSVDLVLASNRDIPLEIFEGVHKDVRERNIENLLEQTLDREENAVVRRIVLDRETDAELKDNERALVLGMLEEADVPIDDTDPEADLPSAYRALRYASAYR